MLDKKKICRVTTLGIYNKSRKISIKFENGDESVYASIIESILLLRAKLIKCEKSGSDVRYLIQFEGISSLTELQPKLASINKILRENNFSFD